jgi:hypothetical protein
MLDFSFLTAQSAVSEPSTPVTELLEAVSGSFCPCRLN